MTAHVPAPSMLCTINEALNAVSSLFSLVLAVLCARYDKYGFAMKLPGSCGQHGVWVVGRSKGHHC